VTLFRRGRLRRREHRRLASGDIDRDGLRVSITAPHQNLMPGVDVQAIGNYGVDLAFAAEE
jgi:hypothetical protein